MRKQKLLSIIILLFFACRLSAQVRMNQTEPYSKHYKTTNQFKKSAVALTSERSIDKRTITVDKDLFFREHKNLFPGQVVAIKVKADYSLKNSGTWEQLKEGRLWRLKISATDASSLNFVFSDFFIPKGASLTIANLDKTQVMGPFKSKHNRKSKTFATHLLYANEVVLEYFEPNSVQQKGKLTIGNIGYGIPSANSSTNEFKRKTGGARFEVPDDPCTYPLENANCSSANDIAEFRRAVCEILIDIPAQNGIPAFYGQGTGTLVNNAEEDCRPLVLTAGHNFPANAQTNQNHFENMVFRFNYLRTGCSGATPVDTPEVIDYCGANFVANWLSNSHDLGVLEMQVVPTYKEYYAGWYNNWDWLNSFSPTVDTKVLGHPENQAMKYYEANIRGVGQYDPRIIIDINYDHFIEVGISGSPFINSNKEIQAVVTSSSHLGCVSSARVTGYDLFTVWEAANWIPPATPPTIWLQDILDPNNVLVPDANGKKRLAGKERHELGCTSNTSNCCMVTTAFFVDETIEAETTAEGFTCCNTLHLEMKDEYELAGCDETFIVRVFEAGSATPIVNSTLTLPSDQTICRDIAQGANFPNTTDYEIHIIDPNTGVVLEQCRQTLSFTCDIPDPCCENVSIQITPLNDHENCCFNISGSVGTCFEAATVELFEFVNSNWVPVANMPPSPGGTYNFNNLCRDNGITLTFKIEVRDANGDIICEKEITHSCSHCCETEPALIYTGREDYTIGGLQYVKCCWDIWMSAVDGCDIGGWLVLGVNDPVPPSIFPSGSPNYNLGNHCSDGFLVPAVPAGTAIAKTLFINRVIATYDNNGNLLCTNEVTNSCIVSFWGGPAGGGGLSAAPNPFDNTLLVKADLDKTTLVNIEIFDNIGRRVFVKDYGTQKAGTFETTIDVSNLAQGVYTLSINNGAKTINIFKEK